MIGAAVNEVCRVESLCKALGAPMLLTDAFAAALGSADVVSLGRHALRGVADREADQRGGLRTPRGVAQIEPAPLQGLRGA